MNDEPQVDFDEPDQNQLAIIVKDSGLEESKAKYILNRFQDYFTMAHEWTKTTKQILVTDASQTHMMDMARAARLALAEKRNDIEKVRKSLKEQSLREGKAIDGISNVLKALIIPLEQYFKEQECFVEIQEAAKAKLIEEEVQARMDAEFEAEQKRKAEEDRRIREENETLKEKAYAVELERRKEREEAERQRLEAERAARAEQERIRRKAEEERLFAEGVARKKLADERAEREKVEAELRAKKLAEQRAEADRIAKEEALKKAGDSEKMAKLMKDIQNIDYPTGLKSEDANNTLTLVHKHLLVCVEVLKPLTEQENDI